MTKPAYDVIIIGAGSVGVPAAWAMANPSGSDEKAGGSQLSHVGYVAGEDR